MGILEKIGMKKKGGLSPIEITIVIFVSAVALVLLIIFGKVIWQKASEWVRAIATLSSGAV